MSLLVLAAHAVTVALGRYRPVALRHWALAGGAGAALVIPLVLISARQHASVSWISRPGATDLRILVQDYFAVAPVAAAVLIACAIVAVLPVRAGNAGTPVAAASERAWAGTGAGTGADSARWWLRAGVSLPSVALPLLIVPAVILIGESLVGPPLYVDRYVLFGESGAALLAGAGLYRVGQWLRTATRRRWLVWAPGAIVCLAVLLLQIGPQQNIRTPGSRLYDFTSPARYLGANARPGDGVLFFDNFFRKDRLVYPRDFSNTDDFGQAESPAQAGSFRGTDKPFATSLPLILGHRRIWVVGVAPSPRLPTLLLRQQSLALLQHFTLVSQRRFRGIDVTLWVRRPGTVPPGTAG
jgi:mannosyltransferase